MHTLDNVHLVKASVYRNRGGIDPTYLFAPHYVRVDTGRASTHYLNTFLVIDKNNLRHLAKVMILGLSSLSGRTYLVEGSRATVFIVLLTVVILVFCGASV